MSVRTFFMTLVWELLYRFRRKVRAMLELGLGLGIGIGLGLGLGLRLVRVTSATHDLLSGPATVGTYSLLLAAQPGTYCLLAY